MIENSHLNYIESQIKSEYLSVPSKAILLEEGKVAEKLYLIRKGCLRLFFYNEGKDITFQFFFEGDFVASFDSLYKRTPSLFYLESIEPTELTVIRRENFYNLINNDLLFRQLYEEKLIDRFHAYQQLFLSRIKNTPQQRYEELLKEYPDIIQRVPQHFILASLPSLYHASETAVNFISLQLLSFSFHLNTELCTVNMKTVSNEKDFCNRLDFVFCVCFISIFRNRIAYCRTWQ